MFGLRRRGEAVGLVVRLKKNKNPNPRRAGRRFSFCLAGWRRLEEKVGDAEEAALAVWLEISEDDGNQTGWERGEENRLVCGVR